MAEQRVSILVQLRDAFSRGIRALSEGLGSVFRGLGRIVNGARAAGRALRRVASVGTAPIRGLGSAFGFVARQLTSFRGLVVGLAGLVAFDRLRGNIDEIGKAGARLGVTVETLSALGLASELGGSNFAELQVGLRTFAKSLDEAKSGTATYLDDFTRLGIEVNKFTGQQKELEKLLPEVAEAFKNHADANERVAIASTLFGRAGSKLLPILTQGREGIEALRREADRLGVTLSTEDVRAFEEFNDALTRVTFSLRGALVRNLASPLRAFAQFLTRNQPNILAFFDTVSQRASQLRRFLVRIWESGESGQALVAGITASLTIAAEVLKRGVGVLAPAASALGRSVGSGLLKGFADRFLDTELERQALSALGLGDVVEQTKDLRIIQGTADKLAGALNDIREGNPFTAAIDSNELKSFAFELEQLVSLPDEILRKTNDQAIKSRVEEIKAQLAGIPKEFNNSLTQAQLERFLVDFKLPDVSRELEGLARQVQLEIISGVEGVTQEEDARLKAATKRLADFVADDLGPQWVELFKKLGGQGVQAASEEFGKGDLFNQNLLERRLQRLDEKTRDSFRSIVATAKLIGQEFDLESQLALTEKLLDRQQRLDAARREAVSEAATQTAPTSTAAAASASGNRSEEPVSHAERAREAYEEEIRAFDLLQQRIQLVQGQLGQGLISPDEAGIQVGALADGAQVQIATIQGLIDLVKSRAESGDTGFPEMTQQVEEWQSALDQGKLRLSGLIAQLPQTTTLAGEFEKSFSKGVKTLGDFSGLGEDLGNEFVNGLGGIVDTLIQADGSFNQFLGSFLKGIASMIAQTLLFRAVSSALGVFGLNGGGEVPTASGGTSPIFRARGGPVPGPNVNRDVVDAKLTPREWVIRREATSYYGQRIMAGINARLIPRELLSGFAVPSRMATPQRRHFGGGGEVAGGGGGGGGVVQAVIAPDERGLERMLSAGSGAMFQFMEDHATPIRQALGVSPS